MLATLLLTVACGGGASSNNQAGGQATLRLGYFANVTHAGAVYGVGSGLFQKSLGGTKLQTQVFNAGPAEVEALFAGSLDAAFIGPSPAINAFVKSKGDAIRIVAGATSGGASLVVKPTITDASKLKGKTIADPQTGGTQDIALRTWLAGKGYTVDARGAGDVNIQSQDNATTLQTFQAGQVDGAWVPEPWASRLVLDGRGTVLVDEKDLWPAGKFVTTVLVVRREFLAAHPDVVTALLEGQKAADAAITADLPAAATLVNTQLKALTGKALAQPVLDRAFAQITLTQDPIASSLKTQAEHAFATGLVKKGPLQGIYDLTLLDRVLGTTVDDAGLGKG